VEILSIFDYTGIMVGPWLAAGHTCTIVDLQHPEGCFTKANLRRIGCDVLKYEPDRDFDIIFAFPPCTHLAISGACRFKDKGLRALIEALTLVERARHICEDLFEVPFMIENPIGMLSTYWRKPDHIFNPCDFGGYQYKTQGEGLLFDELDAECEELDDYTKATCLWTGYGFEMPKCKWIYPAKGSVLNSTMRDVSLRNKTPKGFAQAVYEANRKGLI